MRFEFRWRYWAGPGPEPIEFSNIEIEFSIKENWIEPWPKPWSCQIFPANPMPAGNVVEAPFASNRRKIFVFRRSIYIIQSIELLDVFIIRHAVGYFFLIGLAACFGCRSSASSSRWYGCMQFFRTSKSMRPGNSSITRWILIVRATLCSSRTIQAPGWRKVTEFINFTGLYCLQACLK